MSATIEHAALAFGLAGSAILGAAVRRGELVIPSTPRIRIKREDSSGGLVISTSDEPDLSRLVFGNTQFLRELDEARDLQQAMDENLHCRKHMDEPFRVGFRTLRLSRKMAGAFILSEVLQRAGGFVSSDGAAAEVAHEFQAFINSPTIELTVTLPLFGLSTEEPVLGLAGFTLTPLTKTEREELAKDESTMPFLGRSLAGAYAALRRTVAVEKWGRVQSNIGDLGQADAPMAALRIVLGSAPLLAGIVVRPTRFIPVDSGTRMYTEVRGRAAQTHLNSADAGLVRVLALRHSDAASGSRLAYEAALRRLHLGAERARAEDGLIDYVIALESILSDGRTSTYQLALRSAVVRSATPAERAETFHAVRSAYRVRNSAVHGESVAARDVMEATTIFESTVRAVLSRYLVDHSDKSEKAFVAAIEQCVVDGTSLE